MGGGVDASNEGEATSRSVNLPLAPVFSAGGVDLGGVDLRGGSPEATMAGTDHANAHAIAVASIRVRRDGGWVVGRGLRV